jgi:tripartite-type tricarboxylate transporter receptor subunit TctC
MMRLPGTRAAVAAVVVIVAAAASANEARAADFPTRDIEFIVAYPAGGPADAAARVLSPLLSAALKQPIVVLNKSGSGGIVGSDYAARAKPDGHSIYVATNSPLTINPHLRKQLTYSLADFTALGSFAVDLGAITIRNTVPAKTLDEFVDYARRNPGKLSYGSAGYGTVSFFAMEMFKQAYGLDILHVPFQGTGPVKTALLGNHVLVSASGFGSMAPLIKSGDLIALATTSPTRVAAFPNVPTMAEKGFAEASLNIWMGLFVPVKTPKPVVDLLVTVLAQVAKDPALAAGLEKAGMALDYRDPVATVALLERESATVGKLVEKLKLPKE